MDGLPGMKQGLEIARKEKVEPIKKMVGPLAPKNYQTIRSGVAVETAVVIALASLILGALLALYGASVAAPAGTFVVPGVNTSSISLEAVPILRAFVRQ
jgi:hypothetical protein